MYSYLMFCTITDVKSCIINISWPLEKIVQSVEQAPVEIHYLFWQKNCCLLCLFFAIPCPILASFLFEALIKLRKKLFRKQLFDLQLGNYFKTHFRLGTPIRKK